MTPEEFFAGSDLAIAVFDRVRAIAATVGDIEVRVGKSEVALRRRIGFAYLWCPGRYLSHPQADVVLSIVLGREDRSKRFKQVVHPSTRHWMHHLEVRSPGDIDEEVAAWVREAAERAG